jgi:uncharacterized protein
MDPINTKHPARNKDIDLVRGMALCGMFLVNLGYFTHTSSIPLSHFSGINWLAGSLILFLAEGKFYPILAFFFGWGIARRQEKYLSSTNKTGKGFFLHNLRRMGILGAFGLVHAILLWQGDILLSYAIIGCVLPVFQRIPTKWVIGLACLTLLLSTILAAPGVGQQAGEAYRNLIAPAATPLLVSLREQSNGYNLLANLNQAVLKLLYFPDWIGNFLAAILIGYLSGEGRFRMRIDKKVIILPALLLNLGYTLIWALPNLVPVDWEKFWRTAMLSLGGPFLALVFGLFMIQASQSTGMLKIRRYLECIGCMPLTIYLTQTILGVVIYSRFNQCSPAVIWFLFALTILAQAYFAKAWLRYLRQGPVDAAWRYLSGE